MLQVIVENQTVNFPKKQFSVLVGNLTPQTNYSMQVFGCEFFGNIKITSRTLQKTDAFIAIWYIQENTINQV